MKKILVTFALREEFAPWKRRHTFRDSLPAVSQARIGEAEVYVALAGAGGRTFESIKAITAQVQPHIAIITGTAAGLRPEWRPGEVFTAKSVCAPGGEPSVDSDSNLLGLAAKCGAKTASKLVTLEKIVRTVRGKQELGMIADAADMESLPLMQFWANRGIPALAARVILDPVNTPMTFDFEAAM